MQQITTIQVLAIMFNLYFIYFGRYILLPSFQNKRYFNIVSSQTCLFDLFLQKVININIYKFTGDLRHI